MNMCSVPKISGSEHIIISAEQDKHVLSPGNFIVIAALGDIVLEQNDYTRCFSHVW